MRFEYIFYQKFDLESITGLSDEEAAIRLKKEGYNELPSQKQQSLFSIILNVFREPMLLLLLGAGIIYLFLGEESDALMLLFFVFVVVGITFYQERKKRVPGREVVRDDIMILRGATASLLMGLC